MDNVISFWRTDRWGNPLGRLGYVYEAQRDRTTSGTDTLDISCHTQCDKGDRIIFTDATGKVREYIVTDVEQVREESLQFSYHCSGSMSELGLYVIEDRRVRGGTLQTALTRALEGTRWAVGTVSGSGTNDISYYHTTAISALKDIMDTWGVELEAEYTLSPDGDHIIGRRINATTHLGSSVARPFSFGRNLAGLSRTINADDVITRVYPYGKGIEETDENGEATGGYSRKIDITSVNSGIPYLEDTTATSIWGIPDARGQKQASMSVLNFGDIEDPQELKVAAQAELVKLKSPHVSYEATVSVLGLEGKDRYALGLGDDVHIIDTAYPSVINIQGRVLEIKDDLLNPLSDNTQITLGNLLDVFTDESDRVNSVVDKLLSNSGAWNGAAGAAPPFIDSVINGINVNLNKTGGYTYLTENEGIIVYDRPKDENPTMAIQLGGGYFRIANSKKSNGEWNWRTVGTGAGLVADVLVAGTIEGGSNSWNLETGDLKFLQGSISIAGPNNTRTVIDGTNGFRILQNGSLVGGLTFDGTTAALRASRVGTSATNYLTTGRTAAGNPGASFLNGGKTYFEVEAIHAVDSSAGQTTGVGFSTFDKTCFSADTFYDHVVLYPPDIDNYLDDADVSLVLRNNKTGYSRFAELTSGNSGVFLHDNYAEIRFDSTHYVHINSDGVQCRCGEYGFGWVNGAFSERLHWS